MTDRVTTEKVRELLESARLWPHRIRENATDLAADLLDAREAGVPCELHCPKCGVQHIDQPQPEKGWTNPPHRTHECQACGHLWRPYPVATYGVETQELRRARERIAWLEAELLDAQRRMLRMGGEG